jgi:Subtilisin inhibitor-like
VSPDNHNVTEQGLPTAGGDQVSEATADLTIVVVDAVGTSQTFHLTCEPAGGDHPHPEVACRVLAEKGQRALPPVPPDMQCTQIYGGPETAQITGTWRGQPVSSRLSRQNGCEIARWNALAGFLPRGGS